MEIKLPYPIKVWFATFFIKRKIGFSFNQLSTFLLLNENGIDLNNHKEWMEKTPKNIILLETIYSGAVAYCMQNRKKDNFTKEGLSKALTEAGEIKLNKIIEYWKQCDDLGYRKMPGKKKVKKH